MVSVLLDKIAPIIERKWAGSKLLDGGYNQTLCCGNNGVVRWGAMD